MNARLVIFGLLVTACAESPADKGTVSDTGSPGETGTSVCTSDSYWTGGDRESPNMHPGGACVQCHQDNRGPGLVVAGTVYPTLHEPDDCNGQGGVTVEIIDANDAITTLTTNSAGNFYLRRGNIAFPVRARVTEGDVVREMVTPQMSGDCNSCHTQAGTQAAPGRVSTQ